MDNATVMRRLREQSSPAIVEMDERLGDVSVTIQPDRLVEIAQFLRDDPDLKYSFLENLCGVDYLGREPRFEVVYHFFSFEYYHRVCLKAGVPEEDPTVPSLTGLWPTANWQEREAYDMFGIQFSGHPSLERILMPEDWEGHPQRKDVPLGYEEIAFTFNEERIYVHKPFSKE
jgi:NADH-quinone oxidoreductase subunit C